MDSPCRGGLRRVGYMIFGSIVGGYSVSLWMRRETQHCADAVLFRVRKL